ncbi:MAG TPA: Maf family protein [Caulobacteraceae bacterium]|nr:Maf family protein [Caulobacteraceae bacterium]
MSGPTVTLASQSATRAEVLRAAGVSFEIASSGLDEGAVKASLQAEGVGARDIADALAEGKALKVSRRRPGLVIGADQTLELDGTLFDKAETTEEARAKLKALRGKTHVLHSALVIARDGVPVWRTLSSPRLTMRPFTDAFLDSYLQRNGAAVLSSVGCYQIEGEGAQLFSAVEGDHFAILGLPLMALLDYLRLQGVLDL